MGRAAAESLKRCCMWPLEEGAGLQMKIGAWEGRHLVGVAAAGEEICGLLVVEAWMTGHADGGVSGGNLRDGGRQVDAAGRGGGASTV